MYRAFQIAKFAGIPIKLHWSFVLMFVWVVFEGRRNGMTWEGVGWFAVLVLLLFGCVVLHEFGHALSARHYGVSTKDIILSPIGGVARLNGLPKKPFHEFVVAIAGPMVNFAIAGIIGGYGWFTSSIHLDELGESRYVFGDPDNFISLLLVLNITLGVFNLVPAFPMDGGRIFRSLLSIRWGRRKATRIASYIGQTIALGFIITACILFYAEPTYNKLIFLPIGVFIFYMAMQEYRIVKFEDALDNHKVSDLMRSHFTFFQKRDEMMKAIGTLKRGLEKDFIILNEEGKVEGALHESVILSAAKRKQSFSMMGGFVAPITESASLEETLRSFYQKMQLQKVHILPVIENEQIIGVIDIQQLNDFLTLQQKLK